MVLLAAASGPFCQYLWHLERFLLLYEGAARLCELCLLVLMNIFHAIYLFVFLHNNLVVIFRRATELSNEIRLTCLATHDFLFFIGILLVPFKVRWYILTA